jgi:hypothetical protein
MKTGAAQDVASSSGCRAAAGPRASTATGTTPSRTGAATSTNPVQFSAPLPAASAFYRLDITFRTLGGRLRGTYAEYFRVVPREVHVRLSILHEQLLPGGQLVSRVENRGTSFVQFGRAFAIDRREAGAWLPEPIAPTAFPASATVMGGGLAGDCEVFGLPSNLRPGRYRLRKPVMFEGKARELIAPFAVTEAVG